MAVDARICDGKVLLGSERLQVLGSQQFAAGRDVALGQLRRFLKTLQPNICQDEEGGVPEAAPRSSPGPSIAISARSSSSSSAARSYSPRTAPERPPRNDLQFVHGNRLFEPLKQNAQV